MAPEKHDTSIFTDDSGGRKRAVALAIRGAVVVLGFGAAAVAVSVFGNVKLPGLDAPLDIPGTQAHSSKDSKTTSTRDTGKTSGTGQGSTSTVVPAGQPTTAATPTATPTAKPTGKPTAKPTTAAQPTHKPTAPPGKPTSAPTP